ncbi:histidine utilization repressor [Tianweitania sediminis]|uniref:Histidine utilization repressor n=1 Tax=Tianweitania sediminis TaxID=1502156 RepID=A0A8J7UI51_9HYPH|nr:histidine utilization repressor [Tianweitania sediminis]MBP0437415.1 histidine utilization repressor [Tianweitania sediminis]
MPSGAAPLHRQIRAAIEAKILSGEWLPGTRIPNETELAATYGCARMTVNKALSELAADGLIERRRKSGSVVRQPVLQSAVLEIHDIRAEVETIGLSYRFEILKRQARQASRADCARLQIEEPVPVLALTCLHCAAERPFCLEDRLISLAAVPNAKNEAFAALAPGAWLIGEVPWSTAEHRISAVSAGPDASLLQRPLGSACLAVERRTWNAEQPVTHVRLIYPGDAHALVARFTPSKAG